jgi:hypothetical protein
MRVTELQRQVAVGVLLATLPPTMLLAAAGAPLLHLATVLSDEVLDLRAGPAWARCAEGQRWDGRGCAGAAALLDHGHAIAAATVRGQADDRGGACRVPLSCATWGACGRQRRRNDHARSRQRRGARTGAPRRR